MVLSFGIVPFIHDLLTATIMLVLFAFGLSINNATIASLISAAAPENQRGTILGVGSSLESASGVIMPPITTGTLGLYGVPATAGIAAFFAIVALGMGIAQTRPRAERVSTS